MMDSESSNLLAIIVNLLNKVLQNKPMYLSRDTPSAAVNFLNGVECTCNSFGVAITSEAREIAARSRGWNCSLECDRFEEMGAKGLSEDLITSELIEIEILAWKLSMK